MGCLSSLLSSDMLMGCNTVKQSNTSKYTPIGSHKGTHEKDQNRCQLYPHFFVTLDSSFKKGAIHSTKIPTGPTGKSGPPQKMDHPFRNFSGWTEPFHWVLDLKFPDILVEWNPPGYWRFLRLQRHRTRTSRSHTSTNIVAEGLAERAWWTKSYSSLLKIYIPALAPKYIHFRYGPNVCLPNFGTELSYFRYRSSFEIRGCRVVPLQKSHRNNLFYAWTQASGMVFVSAQGVFRIEDLTVINDPKGNKALNVITFCPK